MCLNHLHQISGYKSKCQGLGTNVDLVELETLDEKEAVYEYWYTQVKVQNSQVLNKLNKMHPISTRNFTPICLLDNSEIHLIY